MKPARTQQAVNHPLRIFKCSVVSLHREQNILLSRLIEFVHMHYNISRTAKSSLFQIKLFTTGMLQANSM